MSVNTAHGAFTVDGVHTEVLVSDYSNRLMVVVTQIGKLGTIYHAADPGPGGVFEGDIPPEVRTLIGRYDDATLEAAARTESPITVMRGSIAASRAAHPPAATHLSTFSGTPLSVATSSSSSSSAANMKDSIQTVLVLSTWIDGGLY